MSDEQPQNIDNIDAYNARYKPLSPEQHRYRQQRFLKVYRETANIKGACKAAKISRQTFYDWRDRDEAFKSQLPDADEDANDTLEQAAFDRAVQGVPSYVVSQGKLVYGPDGKTPLIEYKYSDTLLITRLKARMPEKYKERVANEHSGPGGGPMKVNLSGLSNEELDTLERMAQKAQHGDS